MRHYVLTSTYINKYRNENNTETTTPRYTKSEPCLKESEEPGHLPYSQTGSALKIAWRVISSIIPRNTLQKSMLATTRRTSSCCTGMFTSEMGLSCIQATVNSTDILGVPVDMQPVSCHEFDDRCWPLIREHHKWCNQVTGNTCAQPCLFGDARFSIKFSFWLIASETFAVLSISCCLKCLIRL